ncbi:small acid-soluble spore protein Tlp [Aquibacillus salsiterrae]|uniref:Small, acid-soluble spore protein Tlp n=1 Tax=Aquibacillus salsiterrae TaxID=2950439 RepID=A0A9X3WF54_9BACI|nr:small acid-soluble spore protein Tlp [Aquibacillus salsiterrae]MDC3416284.1 small acid-soluble spore protein Tlp [Aquibacillus salsiterrae]
MSEYSNRPNPDNREDNVEKLVSKIQNTIENIEEAHETMRFASNEEKHHIEAKNKRREEAIQSMRDEVKDEYQHQQKTH